MTSNRPFIAVPAMWSAQIKGLRYSGSVVANAVLDSIARAGGDPFVISPATNSNVWSLVDGMVLPGGSDINPARYGAAADETYVGTDYPEQDEAEAKAIAMAQEMGLPTLLICRGMQLWNVERGGTLVQHWPDDPQQHVDTVHDVEIAANSRLSAALGEAEEVSVSSYHHQAVHRVGAGLSVVATSSDGCVEALEDPDHNTVAVQWHPEDRADSVASDQALFDWVVQEARKRRESTRG